MRRDCKNSNERTNDEVKHSTTMVVAKKGQVLKPPSALTLTGNLVKDRFQGGRGTLLMSE